MPREPPRVRLLVRAFHDWAKGFAQLLEKLASVGAPRPAAENGREIAARSYLSADVTTNSQEILFSNRLPFVRVPERVMGYRSSRKLEPDEIVALTHQWAFKQPTERTFLGFAPPPPTDGIRFKEEGSWLWRSAKDIDGIRSRNVSVELLRKSVHTKALLLGMHEEGSTLFFPDSLLANARLRYTSFDGSNTWLTAIGIRKKKLKRPTKYHLGFELYVRRGFSTDFEAETKVRVRVVDANGFPFPTELALARRKDVARSWWNDEWLNRQLAIWQFLGEDKPQIVIGDGESQVVLAASPLVCTSPIGIDELKLDDVRKRIERQQSEFEEDKETDHAAAQ